MLSIDSDVSYTIGVITVPHTDVHLVVMWHFQKVINEPVFTSYLAFLRIAIAVYGT